MKVYFSVDNPKLGKRERNRGEDAPAINRDGIMIVCDGTGATGQAEHSIDGEIYTSAYLGARETSRLADTFLVENYEMLMASFGNMQGLTQIVTQLGRTIASGLVDYAKKNGLVCPEWGRSFKLLPTTFTAVVYKAYETKVEVIVLSVGDSKALWWDAEGLHQLSIEDSGSKALSVGDCNMSNCVSADADFSILFACHSLGPQGILLATTDGFTDPIKPFEQERFLIEWIGNFEENSGENAQTLSSWIAQEMDRAGFKKRDDCSLAGVILGYQSENAMIEAFENRYQSQLIDRYIIPYGEMKILCSQAEAELEAANTALQSKKEKIVDVVSGAIEAYVKALRDDELIWESELFQTLNYSERVGIQTRKEAEEVENSRKQRLFRCAQEEKELRDGYLDFLKALCRQRCKKRFSVEIADALQICEQSQETLRDENRAINGAMRTLQALSPTAGKGLDDGCLEQIEKEAGNLLALVQQAKKTNQVYRKNKATVDQYFSYDNEKIAEFFREDIENGFEIVKRLSIIPLLPSKTQREMGKWSAHLISLHADIERLKQQATDAYVQGEKNAAYKRVIMQQRGDIARTLFCYNKYWTLLPADLEKTNIPELEQYARRREQFKSVIAARDSLIDSYNNTYGKHLSNTAMQGDVLIARVEAKNYGK